MKKVKSFQENVEPINKCFTFCFSLEFAMIRIHKTVSTLNSLLTGSLIKLMTYEMVEWQAIHINKN